MKKFSIYIAGCGSSGGNPRPGNIDGNWGASNPKDKKNYRTRSSIFLLDENNDAIVIDTSPDFRTQALQAKINKLIAVFYTHDHADQTHGIDDLRSFFLVNKEQINCYFDKKTYETLTTRFNYLFDQNSKDYPAIINAHTLFENNGHYKSLGINDLDFQPVKVNHGRIDALGYRFKNIMYTPDIKYIYDDQMKYFHGLDCWIVDVLQFNPHSSHSNFDDVLEWNKKFKPKKMILTNLSPMIDYESLRNLCPDNFDVAYDNLKVKIT